MANRDAYAAFFLTGKGQFWGSAFHVEQFIDAVKEASDKAFRSSSVNVNGGSANSSVLIDVGAAPYNTVGGDISHVLTFLKNWPATSGATIFGFEPGVAPYSRLVEYVSSHARKSVEIDVATRTANVPAPSDAGAASAPRRARGGATTVLRAHGDAREWIVLRNAPVSDRARSVTIANQPFAGDNTASLEPHYQAGTLSGIRGRPVRAVTLDNELKRSGLADREVLILKVPGRQAADMPAHVSCTFAICTYTCTCTCARSAPADAPRWTSRAMKCPSSGGRRMPSTVAACPSSSSSTETR